MTETNNVIVIGAGHNGLVAAFYLAKAGLKPLVLERRPVVGGAAITEGFHTGFRCPALVHHTSPLAPEIAQEMKLERRGLEMIHPQVRVFAPSRDGRALCLYDDVNRSAQEVARFSKKDAAKFLEFHRTLTRLAGFLRPWMSKTPPQMNSHSSADLWNLLKVGRRFRSLGKKDMFCLLRWLPMPVADLTTELFETDLLRAVIAARGIFGNLLGPRSPGSSAVLLLRAAGDAHPAGAASFPQGGMGSLAQAMLAAATQAGAEIRTGAEVARIEIKGGRATRVTLANGEELAAQVVVSSADPPRTFLKLVGAAQLEPSFVAKIQSYRCAGTVAKVNLALSGLPSFAGLEKKTTDTGTNHPLAGRIHIGPEIDYLEHAFDDAKYGAFSRQPVLDIAIPSVADPTLAPPGRHVMSILSQFAPYNLKDGNWNSQREALGDAVVKTLASCAPDLPGLILHRQVITPLDLEETYALTGGHIFHGELSLDQLFAMRPIFGWAQYRTPVAALYLCGSGTHPGTGLDGLSGRNAAREILKDWRKFK